MTPLRWLAVAAGIAVLAAIAAGSIFFRNETAGIAGTPEARRDELLTLCRHEAAQAEQRLADARRAQSEEHDPCQAIAVYDDALSHLSMAQAVCARVDEPFTMTSHPAIRNELEAGRRTALDRCNRTSWATQTPKPAAP